MSVLIKPIKIGTREREPIISKVDVLNDIYDIMTIMRISDVVNKEKDKIMNDIGKARNEDKKTYLRLVLNQLIDDDERQKNKNTKHNR